MHNLIGYVCDELEELDQKAAQGKLSMAELQLADTLAHLKKNLLKAESMMGESESMNRSSYEYSNGSERSSRNSYGRSRGGSSRRDSRGRYSRDGGSSRYSRDGSGNADEFVEHLEDMIEMAPDEWTKSEIEKLIKKAQQAS